MAYFDCSVEGPRINANGRELNIIYEIRVQDRLEDMGGVAKDIITEQRLERTAVYNVGGAVEEFADEELQPGVLEDPHGLGPIEIYQHIDVAIRARLSARNGTKYRGVRDAKPPQLALVSAKSLSITS